MRFWSPLSMTARGWGVVWMALPAMAGVAGPALAAGMDDVHAGDIDRILAFWWNFVFVLPSAMALAGFAALAVLTALLFRLAYTGNLRSQIRLGVHPHIIAHTMLLGMLVVWALLGLLMLPGIGHGFFALLFVILIVACVISLAISQIMAMWGVILLFLIFVAVLLRTFGVV